MNSESIGELTKALATAKGQFRPVKKNKSAITEKFSYKYTDLSELIDATEKALSANGLCVIQLLDGDRAETRVRTVLAHTSGELIGSEVTVPVQNNGRMSDAQAMGTAITYMRRYAYSAILGIAGDEDTDAVDTQESKHGHDQSSDARQIIEEIAYAVKKKMADGSMSESMRDGFRQEVAKARDDAMALRGILHRIYNLGKTEPDDHADLDTEADAGWDATGDKQQDIPTF
jgi:hypothetical protein